MAVYLFVSYFVMRFSLVLPASALEHRLSFTDSWAVPRGNGLVLALPVCIPAFLTSLLFWILDTVLGNSGTFLSTVPYMVVSLILMAVEIAVLSVAYKYLVFVSPDKGTDNQGSAP